MSGRPCAVYHPQTPLPETLESLAAQVPLRRRRCESDATEVSGSVGVGVGRPVGSEAVRFSSFVLRSALCAVCPSSPPRCNSRVPCAPPPSRDPRALSCDQVHVVIFGFFDIFQQRWGEGFLSARQGLGFREEGRPNRAKPCERAEFGARKPGQTGRRGREM